jgi:hypothetical protein
MNESLKRWQREVEHLYIGSIPCDLLPCQDASLTSSASSVQCGGHFAKRDDRYRLFDASLEDFL